MLAVAPDGVEAERRALADMNDGALRALWEANHANLVAPDTPPDRQQGPMLGTVPIRKELTRRCMPR